MIGSKVLPSLSASPLALDFASFHYEPLQAAVETAVESPIKTFIFTLIPIVAAYFFFNLYIDHKLVPGFPVVGSQKWDLFRTKARLQFLSRGDKVVEEGIEQHGDEVFQVAGHSSPYLVVPLKYMNELRNEPKLSMTGAAAQDFFLSYKPFHAVKAGLANDIVVKTVQKKLTPLLGLVTEPVNEENNIAIPQAWPATNEWKEHLFVDSLQRLVSQVSSRVFLGAPLCRNEEWIKIAIDYTLELMTASYSMQYIPRLLRPFIYRFLGAMTTLEKTTQKARNIIEPEVERRRLVAAEAKARGEKHPKALDAIDWMIETAEDDSYDITAGQLSLTFAAIHTTSTTTTHLMYDILEAGMVEPLREEIIQAYTEDGGWSKTTLYKLKLLDSCMKESQRINCLSPMTITRFVDEAVTLSNGVTIPKGVRFIVPNPQLKDEEYYKDAKNFDGYRFLKLREEPGASSKYQFAAPTFEHNAFGLGQHSCPGRFFASNEIKLIMAHLLLKFDWKFKDGVGRPPKLPSHGGSNLADGSFPIMYKSRTPEVDF